MAFGFFAACMHALLAFSIPRRESISMYSSVLKRSHHAGELLATLQLYADYGDNKTQRPKSHSNSLSLGYSTRPSERPTPFSSDIERLLREDPSEHMVVEEGRNVHAKAF